VVSPTLFGAYYYYYFIFIHTHIMAAPRIMILGAAELSEFHGSPFVQNKNHLSAGGVRGLLVGGWRVRQRKKQSKAPKTIFQKEEEKGAGTPV
jgi:hypothetical protein